MLACSMSHLLIKSATWKTVLFGANLSANLGFANHTVLLETCVEISCLETIYYWLLIVVTGYYFSVDTRVDTTSMDTKPSLGRYSFFLLVYISPHSFAACSISCAASG